MRSRFITRILVGLIGVVLLIPVAPSAYSQDPLPQTIESDDPQVIREGEWLNQTASGASGGAYLYSSPTTESAALQLSFSGSTIGVVYVSGPGLGILVIEVDGTVLRTVITAAETTTYGQVATINYLTDEPHTLRVYAQAGGVIGVDAFIAISPNPTPETTATDIPTPRASLCGSDDPTHRVSIASDGTQGNGLSSGAGYSGDGQYVVFSSDATNLVSGDTNGTDDAFIRDRLACTTTRVSIATDGTQGNNASGGTSISDDGRYVAFSSLASNLVSGDTNNVLDIFVRDLTAGTTTRVSVATGGTQANERSWYPQISADGQFVVFWSLANNLVSGDTNNADDIFVHDRTTGTTTRVSVDSVGVQGNSNSVSPDISSDGRYVAFMSYANNLVSGDTNLMPDIFVHDRTTGITSRVSVGDGGIQGNGEAHSPQISGDGRHVVFGASSSNLVVGDTNARTDIFVYDQTTHTTARVSVASDGTQANEWSTYPAISTDGRYVAFWSLASNLTSVNTLFIPNVYIHDLTTGETRLVSVGVDGGLSEFGLLTIPPGISANGQYVSFVSDASNLVVGDTNGQYDVFVRDTFAAPTGPLAPTGLSAATFSSVQINLQWTDNSPSETNYGIERSPDGVSDWSQIGSTGANTVTFSDTVWIGCATTYYYRVRAFRSGDGLFSAYSNVASATTLPCAPAGTDGVMLVRPSNNTVYLRNNLADPPPAYAYGTFTAQPPAPALNGQWVMGDWDGNGSETPGVYASNGVFYYTNTLGTTTAWNGIWIGLFNRPPIAGRLNAGVNHDCIGVVDSGEFPPYGTAFALYFTCDLTNGTAPSLTYQWLSVLLPDNQGFSGPFQFIAGDYDGNAVDSIAVRRGPFVTWTNIPPTTLLSEFPTAQYVGAPSSGDGGQVVSGDWDQNGIDSFGLYYQDGLFYRRNDLDWNSGIWFTLSLGTPLGTPTTMLGWD
ncbi:MAG: hypothetical protein K8L91_04885 [Anaerolineae bacterium]|nr:hypothetical protein [Anaerolineae bacterium]